MRMPGFGNGFYFRKCYIKSISHPQCTNKSDSGFCSARPSNKTGVLFVLYKHERWTNLVTDSAAVDDKVPSSSFITYS